MYLIAIGWLYVALMMSVAEATNTTGTVLGAVFTFLLYGLMPVALVLYLLGGPARKKRRKEKAATEHAAWLAAQKLKAASVAAVPISAAPDAGGEAAAAAIAPVRKEP